MKFFHHRVIIGIQWMMVQWRVVRVHSSFKDLGKHVHSRYRKSYFKKFHITNRTLCLELNNSLSLITIFAFCCWPVFVCCFLVTSFRLVGGHGIPHPPNRMCLDEHCPNPFDNNTNCQTQGRKEGHPVDQGECCPSLVL
jgi:hypothetical protein